MKLPRALAIALTIREQLLPFCEEIEIAGSIRRVRPIVNDIDLVILPKAGRQDAIKARCLKNCSPVTDGPQNCIYRLRLADQSEIQLDIFFARAREADLLDTKPGNFGSLLLCRTGSKEHNIYLVERAKQLGLRWNPYAGVFDGDKCIASETEAAIFGALNLDCIAPERRER